MRSIPKASLVTLWPCGDMFIANNPHSLHLFVVEGTPVMGLGQTTATIPRFSIYHHFIPRFCDFDVASDQ
jgi:hypothetical protein